MDLDSRRSERRFVVAVRVVEAGGIDDRTATTCVAYGFLEKPEEIVLRDNFHRQADLADDAVHRTAASHRDWLFRRVRSFAELQQRHHETEQEVVVVLD